MTDSGRTRKNRTRKSSANESSANKVSANKARPQARNMVNAANGAAHPDYGAVIKGRGTSRNDASRFAATTTERVDDGWGPPDPEDEPRLATTALPDRTVRLITTNRSPDIPFDQSINPYKGCEHGCVYCYARPTHAYLDLSPGLDFETRLFYKTNVKKHLADELGHKSYQPSVIAMGTNTDPYQPLEKQRQITREILETLLQHRHPVSIVTKSALVLRDIDLLSELAKLGLVRVLLSVTTLSNELKTKLEPRTASPAARLRAIRGLADAGVPVGALAAPVIPFINDHELEDIVRASVEAGARTMSYVLLRLPLEVKPLFETWLEQHYPYKKDRVMAAIRASRNGKAYEAQWGTRMRGEGVFADLIAARFRTALKKHGIEEGTIPATRTDLFVRPGDNQMSLF